MRHHLGFLILAGAVAVGCGRSEQKTPSGPPPSPVLDPAVLKPPGPAGADDVVLSVPGMV